MKFKLVERWDVESYSGVTSDHIIEIKSKNQKLHLRKNGFITPETGKFMYILTNNFQLDASAIDANSKERWEIKLFFKEIKQKLKIKHFLEKVKMRYDRKSLPH